MTKKDLSRVTADLAELAGELPAQRRRGATAAKSGTGEPAEETSQFSLSLRKSLRKELARLAAEADTTMRAFVLEALRDKGLNVVESDLADLRKERDREG